MFYHWLAPLGQTHIIFNLFNYISFRAAGATVTQGPSEVGGGLTIAVLADVDGNPIGLRQSAM